MTELNRIAPDLVEAQNRVEMNRTRLDEQLRTLQERIEAGSQALRKMIGTARELSSSSSTEGEDSIRNLTVFLMAGFLLGGMIAKRWGGGSEGARAAPGMAGPLAQKPAENPVHGTSGARMPEPRPSHPIHEQDLPDAWTRKSS